MSTAYFSPSAGGRRLAQRLLGHYARTAIWFLGGIALLWLVGIEGVWAHPTPFYALWSPAFTSPLVPLTVAGMLLGGAAYAGLLPGVSRARQRYAGLVLLVAAPLLCAAAGALRGTAPPSVLAPHILVIALGLAGIALFTALLRRAAWTTRDPTPRETRALLTGMVVFFFAMACAVACLRGWPEGITQSYDRQAYEYIGDIGKARSIRDLFARYLELHPYLSLHAKAQPPGPIALLWIFSWFVGRTPLALALATALFSALALLPLYAWARDLAGCRTALLACALYALAPGPLLFSATSADMLFVPFLLATLFLFGRALHRASIPYALAAGGGYAVLGLLKFSLLAVGFYFAAYALWQLYAHRHWRGVVLTALFMSLALVGTHTLVWLWSGFDWFGTLFAAKAQFDADQHHLDLFTPRYAAWVYRLLNPLAWFWFAGLPVSLLFLRACLRPPEGAQPWVLVMFATLLVLNLLYLGRGEAERSALYVYPFFVVPAAALLQQWTLESRHLGPLAATLGALLAQSWATEGYFYTYW